MQQKNDKEQMILDNQGLVRYFAKKYLSGYDSFSFDDVCSEGNIGLIKAAMTFDESKGIKFSSYAGTCIENQILMFLRREKKVKDVISLNSLLSVNKDGRELILEDVIKNDENSEFTEELEVIKDIISIILNVFPSRTRQMMLYRICGYQQDEIANKFSLSQSYISRIQKKCIQKIRLYLETDCLPLNPIFSITLENYFFKITFNRDFIVNNFEDNYRTIFLKLKNFPKFSISVDCDKIVITMPADAEYFELVADLLS